ncbi:hypothetical protein EJB05_33841, partial [Eragrostis curvula]
MNSAAPAEVDYCVYHPQNQIHNLSICNSGHVVCSVCRDKLIARDATTSPTAGNQWLFLLNVVRQPLDRVISMLCIHPHTSVDEEDPSSKGVECNLWYSNFQFANNRHKGDRLIDHYQMSTFRVPCTDLSNGLPNQEDCFRFVVPKSVLEDHEDVGESVDVPLDCRKCLTNSFMMF